MLLIEPMGLLSGQAARDAVLAGLAHSLAGGPAAFSLARLHGDGPARIVPATAIPPAFSGALATIAAAPPPWAGLPTNRAAIMGIVNVTPDSFSDGGDRLAADAAIEAGLAMFRGGADIIDVGGESTRPGSDPTPLDIEQARVLPVIAALAAEGIVSIDTRNAATMRAALQAGARLVNDVSGFLHDEESAALVRNRGCPAVVMHMRGTPRTMASLTLYEDVAVDMTRELAARLRRLDLGHGQIAVDPGIGFAKGPGQNETILARLTVLLNLGCRILVGASRKGFVARASGTDLPPKARLPGSLAAAAAAVLGGAAIVRVHDVPETCQFLRVWEAIRAAG